MTKKIFFSFSLFVSLLFVPLLCNSQELVILHTNDTHSHLYPFGPEKWGGIARISHLIQKARYANGNNILSLHAGDAFVGTFAFNKYLGYAELKMMEEMYDVWCLGNHEFDLGPDNLAGILAGIVSGGSPITLPTLCANVKLPKGHPLGQFIRPHMIVTRNSIRIGLIGVVTADPFNYSAEVNAMLRDPYEAAGKSAQILRSRGCDVVICLSHLGKLQDEYGLSLVPGIDIIVGGHSHDAIAEPEFVNGKIIVQAGAFNRYLGELRVNVDRGHGRVDVLDYRLYEITQGVKKNPLLLKQLKEIQLGVESDPRFGKVYTERVATAKWDLEQMSEPDNPSRDSALGNLITDALRDAVYSSGIQLPGGYPLIAFEANGYIAHKIYEGKIVGNDILRAVPYGYDPISGLNSKVKVVLLAGAQLLAGLEFSTSVVEYTDELSLQASGITFAYDSSKPAVTEEELMEGKISRIDPTSILIGDVPIDPEGLYWIVLDELLLNFLTSLNVLPFEEIETGMFLYDVVKNYMMKLRVLRYEPEGRIIDMALMK